ncbi:MAG: NADH-quinone oxidoreductase subunit L [Lentisphaeria bacterium]|nr:NADH-quinone oxidoreductase subunit L [Lentisphaeria bacterium]
MMESVLLTLIGAPVICGALAWISPAKVRSMIVVLTAAIVAVCGIGLVWLSMGDAADWNSVVMVSAPAWTENLGVLLELAVVLVILAVALKIRNVWIAVFAVLQLALAAGTWMLPGMHEEVVSTLRLDAVAPALAEHVKADSIALFRIDSLARIMLLVTSIVGSAIVIFSLDYMKAHEHHAPATAASTGQFYFFFLAFLGFMSGLVISENLTFLSLFWEATTFCSYALIGHDGGEARRVNATRALLINSFGGVCLMAGIFLIKYKLKGESFELLLSNSKVMLLPAILLCVAAFTKSALFPFQSWLLGAMVAPTPVSAMLHAATMVKAGVYLVMRVTPGFHDERAMTFVAIAGAITFVGGALLACTQSNGKKVLAYSTISNLGLIVSCAGINSPLAYVAGLSIISFHAISKGLLFLCVGRIEQVIGSRDIEDMDGMYFKMPFTTCVAWVGMVSMLLPPFGMLMSKWLAIEATILSPVLFVFMVTGSALTVFFWAKWIGRMQNTGYHSTVPQEKIPAAMRLSLGFLALLVVVTGGLTILIFNKIFDPMTRAVFKFRTDVDWGLFDQAGQSQNAALLIYGAMLLALLIYVIFFLMRFQPKNVRLPYLCGENIEKSEVNGEAVRTYDFRSLKDEVERAHVSSIYFHGVIDELFTTRILRWAAWLTIIVMLGLGLAK